MKKLKVMLEYKCFPIWLYDEDEQLLRNDLPDELQGDAEIDSLCVELQEEFDSLFQNNRKEFKYKGFLNTNGKALFLKKVNEIERILRERVGNEYRVINAIESKNL